MAGNVIDELVSTLYEIIDEAPSLPLSSKCSIDREKALDILEEIRANLPVELQKANEVIERSDDYVARGQREYEAKIKQAEELAKQRLDDHELQVEARKRANIIVTEAEKRAAEIMKEATAFCEDAMKRTETSISETMNDLKATRQQFVLAMRQVK